jgi:hypothetical protein
MSHRKRHIVSRAFGRCGPRLDCKLESEVAALTDAGIVPWCPHRGARRQKAKGTECLRVRALIFVPD